MSILKKLKIELLYDPAIPLLGIYPEKTMVQKDTYTPMFIAALFTIAKTVKLPKCPSTDERIKKKWSMYTMNTALFFNSFPCLKIFGLFPGFGHSEHSYVSQMTCGHMFFPSR